MLYLWDFLEFFYEKKNLSTAIVFIKGMRKGGQRGEGDVLGSELVNVDFGQERDKKWPLTKICEKNCTKGEGRKFQKMSGSIEGFRGNQESSNKGLMQCDKEKNFMVKNSILKINHVMCSTQQPTFGAKKTPRKKLIMNSTPHHWLIEWF